MKACWLAVRALVAIVRATYYRWRAARAHRKLCAALAESRSGVSR